MPAVARHTAACRRALQETRDWGGGCLGGGAADVAGAGARAGRSVVLQGLQVLQGVTVRGTGVWVWVVCAPAGGHAAGVAASVFALLYQ